MASITAVTDCIVRHFQNRRSHAKGVVTGPSCERWLTSEMRWALNWDRTSPLSRSEFVASEQTVFSRKLPDVTIFTDVIPTNFHDVNNIIEAKVVYADGKKNNTERIQDLKTQIDAHRSDVQAAKASCGIHGFVFACWENTRAKRQTSYEMNNTFFKRVASMLAVAFADPQKYTWTPRQSHQFTVLVPVSTVQVGPWNKNVSLALFVVDRH